MAGATYQNHASTSGSASSGTKTIAAFDPGSDVNRALAVLLAFGNGSGNQPNPTSFTVKYGGVSLTQIPGCSILSDGAFSWATAYYLNSLPSSTPSNIDVAWTNNNDYAILAVAANGVDQNIRVRATYPGAGSTGTSVGMGVLCGADDLSCVIVTGGAGKTLTGATQTERMSVSTTSQIASASTGSLVAPYGSGQVNHRWAQSLSDVWAACGFAFVGLNAKSAGFDSTLFPKGGRVR